MRSTLFLRLFNPLTTIANYSAVIYQYPTLVTLIKKLHQLYIQ